MEHESQDILGIHTDFKSSLGEELSLSLLQILDMITFTTRKFFLVSSLTIFCWSLRSLCYSATSSHLKTIEWIVIKIVSLSYSNHRV